MGGERLDPTANTTDREIRADAVPMDGRFSISVVVESDPEGLAAAAAALHPGQCTAPGGAPGSRISRVDAFQRSASVARGAGGSKEALPAPASATACKEDAVGIASELDGGQGAVEGETEVARRQRLTECAGSET